VQTSSVDKQLKQYVMRTFAVKQRTLQRWLKAGVVPGLYRTKGGHYRIRTPKGMTPDKLPTFEAVRAATETPRDSFPVYAYFMVAKMQGIPESFVHWFCRLWLNVRDYQHLMRPIWQHERNTGAKVPFHTLEDLKALAKEGARRMREATSSASPSSVGDFLETFQPMGENPLERVQ